MVARLLHPPQTFPVLPHWMQAQRLHPPQTFPVSQHWIQARLQPQRLLARVREIMVAQVQPQKLPHQKLPHQKVQAQKVQVQKVQAQRVAEGVRARVTGVAAKATEATEVAAATLRMVAR
jgi:hypothetical protein